MNRERIFRLGDVVSISQEEKESLGIVVGASFVGPPSFLGVIHVLANNEIMALFPEAIGEVQVQSSGREVEFR